jgi:hypothetical protein
VNGDVRTPGLLEERGLFAFTPAAHDELGQFFDDPAIASRSTPLLRELVHLTAAEYALVPILVEPRSVLPVAEPFTVDTGPARVALVKANCVIIEYHTARVREYEQLTLADVTAFSGDLSKLETVGLSSQNPPTEIGDVARAVDELERLHLAEPSEIARAIGESGVLRLQGFLWAVKLSLPRQDIGDAVTDAFDAFELSKPVGGVATRRPVPA